MTPKTDNRKDNKPGPNAYPTVIKVVLTTEAATIARQECIARCGDAKKATVSAFVSAQVEALRHPNVIQTVIADARALLPWLETARQQCINEAAQADLDHLIAAVWSKLN